jgi:hypothetical protein
MSTVWSSGIDALREQIDVMYRMAVHRMTAITEH